MAVTQEDLNRFQQFALERLSNGGAESMDELFYLWRVLNPTPEEQQDVRDAIRVASADLEAGRHRPAAEVTAEIRRRLNIPTQ